MIILLIIAFLSANLFLFLKADASCKHFFETKNEIYPGFLKAFFSLNLIQLMEAFMPIPVPKKGVSKQRYQSIFKYCIFLGFSFLTFIIVLLSI